MEHAERIHRGAPTTLAALLYRMTGLETDQVALLIAMGGAYVGNRRCKNPDQAVASGDQVAAWWQLPLVMAVPAFDPAWVVDRTRSLLVAAKPAGLPTQGRRDADYMAFYELLKARERGYLALHHRLDQDTSGLMLFCRDRAANADVARLFGDRLIEKHYLAYCVGSRPAQGDSLTVHAPIAARREATGTRQVVDPAGKAAETRVRLVARHGDRVLLACTPKTGRTHQIRVHLTHLGLPLVGDALYGPAASHSFLLHCYGLSWPRVGNVAAGAYRLAPPAGWWAHTGPELQAGFEGWWETTC